MKQILGGARGGIVGMTMKDSPPRTSSQAGNGQELLQEYLKSVRRSFPIPAGTVEVLNHVQVEVHPG